MANEFLPSSMGHPETGKNIVHQDGDQIAIETINLIYKAQDKLQLDEEHTKIVLVLGDTGAGKSTVTKFVTGKPLTAIKSGVRYLIEDQDNKIKANLISHTFYPEKYINVETNCAYYDFAGFNDTRSPQVQLVNAWATKTVADHAQSTKILIVSNFSSLLSGGSRTDFKNLLELIINFLPEVAKFNKSMVLIASKVDHFIEDQEIVPAIVEFLQQARKDVEDLFGDDQGIVRSAKAIIDAFLVQDQHGNYTRIGYFKQPKEPGKFDLQPYFRERKNSLCQMVERDTEFTQTSPDDFEISVSPEARLYVRIVIDKLNGKLKDQMESISSCVQQNFKDAIRNPAHPMSIRKLLDDVASLERTVEKLKNCYTRPEFIQTLNRGLGHSPTVKPILKDLEKLNGFLDFYSKVDQRPSPAHTAEWIAPLFDTLEFIKYKVVTVAESLNAKTDRSLNQLIFSIKMAFSSTLTYGRQEDYSGQRALLKKASEDLLILQDMTSSLPLYSTFNSFIDSVNKSTKKLSIINTGAISDLDKLPDDIEFMRLPQLKTDSWRGKFTEMVRVTSSELSEFRLRLQRDEHEGEITSRNNQIVVVKEELQKSKEEAVKIETGLREILDKKNKDTEKLLEDLNREKELKLQTTEQLHSMKEQASAKEKALLEKQLSEVQSEVKNIKKDFRSILEESRRQREEERLEVERLMRERDQRAQQPDMIKTALEVTKAVAPLVGILLMKK